MRKSITLFAGLLLALTSIASFAEQAPSFVEGRDYTRIVPAQPSGGPDEVVVEEFFMYTCPHCFHFEPIVQRWLKTAPAYVNYRRVPLATEHSRPIFKLHAKAFYTAKQLSVLDKIHMVMFSMIHVQREMPDSMEELATLFENAAGVDKETFTKAMNSFAVNSQLRRGSVMADRYGIKVTPTLIVNGKYLVQPGPDGAGSHERVLEVVDYLIAKEMSAE